MNSLGRAVSGVGAVVLAALIATTNAEDNTTRVFSGVRTNLQGPLIVGATGTNNSATITEGATVTNTDATVGEGPAADGNAVFVTGPGSSWTCHGGLAVGERGSGNLVVVSNGASLVTAYAWLNIYDPGRSNEVRVVGAGALWTNSGRLMVGGSFNPAQLNVLDGGRVLTDHCTVGSYAIVGGPGSSLAASTLEVARRLLVTDGAHAVADTAVFGAGGPVNTKPAVDISGPGSSWLISRSLGIDSPGSRLSVTRGGRLECPQVTVRSDQTVTVEDEGSSWWTAKWLWLDCTCGQAAKTNQLTIARGGTLAVTNEAGDAVFALGDAHVSLDGGNLLVDRWLATNAPSTLNLRSGTIRFGDAGLHPDRQPLVLGDESGSGVLDIRGGSLTITNDLTLLSNVVLAVTGDVGGHLTNRGVLRPGAPSLRFGRYGLARNFYNQGTVAFDLTGAREGFDYGSLLVSNRAFLGGRLEVTLASGFRPAWTNQFTLMRWGSYEGAFTNAAPGSRLTVGAGAFHVVYTPDALVLTDYVSDLDGDGVDDLWAQTYFGHSPLTPIEQAADADGDGAGNRAEFVAGTDPTNPQSVFRLLSATIEAGAVRIRFAAVLGKAYRVWFSSALPVWAEVVAPVFSEPVPGVFEWMDDGSATGSPPGGPKPRFYRLGAE